MIRVMVPVVLVLLVVHWKYLVTDQGLIGSEMQRQEHNGVNLNYDTECSLMTD